MGRDRDLAASDIIRLRGGGITMFRAGEIDDIDAVAVLGLVDCLVDQLPRRAEIDDALLELAPTPFGNQEPYSIFPLPVGNWRATSVSSTISSP